MKKNIIFLVMLSITTFFSCSDDSAEVISRVTNYVTFDIQGDKEQVITLGSTFSDAGVIAMEGENDVTDQVTTTGTVDTNTIGLYKIKYSATNVDGFDSSAERYVLVVPENLSSLDVSGTYSGQREGTPLIGEACTISKIKDGVFKATDFFGGYYAIGRGYGTAYSLVTYFYLNTDNTYSAIDTSSPWGPWNLVNTNFDPNTNALNHRVTQGSFGFNVTLTK